METETLKWVDSFCHMFRESLVNITRGKFQTCKLFLNNGKFIFIKWIPRQVKNFGIYGIFSLKNLSSLCKLTFGNYANSNMLNLTLLLIFFVLDWKYPFLSNFGPKN